MPIPPARFWARAATYGSMITNGDPGACMYTFDEDGIVRSEEHRSECIAWLEGFPNPDPEEQREIADLLEYLREAPIGVRPDFPTHVDWTLEPDDLPIRCIAECSQAGNVEAWRQKLTFTVDQSRARHCLQGYGAWCAQEIAAMSDDDVADRILWLACCDFKEGGDLFVLE